MSHVASTVSWEEIDLILVLVMIVDCNDLNVVLKCCVIS